MTVRYVVVGAGAVGGVLSARLTQIGKDVTLVARGGQYDAVRRHGLRVERPSASATVGMDVAATTAAARITSADVVVLAVKSHHTARALEQLADCQSPLAIVCAQNGVANERASSQVAPNVYGASLVIPATSLVDGVVQVFRDPPVLGACELGRYPSGIDDICGSVARDWTDAGIETRTVSDIMSWKYAKLLLNLGNVIDALLDDEGFGGELHRRAEEEATACYRAAQIELPSRHDIDARNAVLSEVGTIGGRKRGGGSMWQDVARGRSQLEIEYLNGAVVAMGGRYGIPTPVNKALCDLAHRALGEGRGPRSFHASEVNLTSALT